MFRMVPQSRTTRWLLLTVLMLMSLATGSANAAQGAKRFTGSAGQPQQVKLLTVGSAQWMAAVGGHWSGLGSNLAGTDGVIDNPGPPGIAKEIDVIAVSGTDVYVGGCFQNAGGAPTADFVAKWDGAGWSGIGNDGGAIPNGALKSCIRALAVSGTDVYVGGYPTLWVNGAAAPQGAYLAKWDGASWSGLGNNGAGGSSINNMVTSIAVNGNNVYVGGQFYNINNHGTVLNAADYIARWDTATSNWSALGANGAGDGALVVSGGLGVEVVKVLNSEVFVGGYFTAAYNGPNLLPEAAYIAKWTALTGEWSGLGSNGAAPGGPLNKAVVGIAVDDAAVYAAGSFEDVNNSGTVLSAADYVAKWDRVTSEWSALGSNGAGNGALKNWPSSYAAYTVQLAGSEVYVGGFFTDVSNNGSVLPAADYVAKWDALTASWSALGSDGSGNGAINANVNTLGLLGDQLLAGGRFTNVSNNGTVLNTADYIAAFDPAPVVNAITRASPNPSTGATVDFTVTFSESVTGVDSGDFSLSAPGVSGATIASVSGSGVTRTVTVNTGAGSGTLRLDLLDNDSILDGGGNPLGGGGAGNGSYTGGEVYTLTKGFRLSGRFLLDANGNNFVMRGVNHPHNWYLNELGSLADIKAWGANTVRVVLSSGQNWPKNEAADVANVISQCKANRLICVLEVHDTTGYGEDPAAVSLADAVTYWKEIQSVLTGQEAYVIINLGNEPYGNNNSAAWVNATEAAVLELRNAGFRHTLMVDAPNWGQDWESVMRNNAAAVLASDPDHNLVFSVHMYGVYETASSIQNYVSAFVNAGLPLVIGEFGWNHSDGNPDEDTLMSVAQTQGIGYLGWVWSGDDYLDLVKNFDPAQLTWWGNRLFFGTNGIAGTACQASVYPNGNCAPTITGNTGIGGVTLSYTDGTLKTVLSQADGSYSLPISYGWDGTVTPTHACYTFNPANRPYIDVTADLTGEDYTPVFNAASGCANIKVDIAGVNRGTYVLPPQGSQRVTYPLDAGPAKVYSTNALPLIAALRDAYYVNGQVESFAQLMGLPKEQLSDTYYFPAYNNVTLSGQLRFANVDTIPTTVTVTIGGVVRGTYDLQPSQSQRVTYNLDTGPVVISSSGGAKIIAALRDAYYVNGQLESFVQLMGLPKEQLADTYYFPAYNNLTLDGQLRFANVDTVQTDVTVTIGGVVRGVYTLQPSESKRVSYALDTGPVIISSSGGAKIIAALRDAYSVNGQIESFSQLMGLPKQQLADTFYFPAYNNLTLSGQLRFANLDSVPTDVTITIGGINRGTYTLQPGQSQRVTYNLDTGPVVITSTGNAKIIAALRDAYYVNNSLVSFVQLMGLPGPALSDTYYFPAYNNLTLSGQLRFGVP